MTRHVTRATIDDAAHYSDEERAAIIASYPPHERDARAKGVPALGSGRIFPVAEGDILIDPFRIPPHWPLLGGMDIGYDPHPTAAVRVAFHPEIDGVVVTHDYRVKGQVPDQHARILKHWGRDLSWAWPRDALAERAETGRAIKDMYLEEGLRMLPEPAHILTTTDAGKDKQDFGVEAGLWVMLQMMQTNRFKVFKGLEDWLSEFRLYHRKDGKIVKEFDDLMDATRYAVVMRRYAVPARVGQVSAAVPDSWDA